MLKRLLTLSLCMYPLIGTSENIDTGDADMQALIFPATEAQQAAYVTPSINEELAEHTQLFEKKIYQVGDHIYLAVGWAIGNTTIVDGEDGLIVIDVGEDVSSQLEVKAQFAKEFPEVAKKPVKAIIYSHHHPDHVNGAGAWVEREDVINGDVEIIAHNTLMRKLGEQGSLVGPILSIRSLYSFGSLLPPEEMEDMNNGIGPIANLGAVDFIPPTVTFADTLDVEIAGVKMHLVHVPSEADDEIVTWFPDWKILQSGEVMQGPTLPNIHSLRGTRFRDPVKWVHSLDVLRRMEPQDVVPSHGPPIYGAEKSYEVLTKTRDAIAYIHDQTIRYMNKGYTPDEIVEAVQLPPELANYKPYVREYYGTVSHAVRQIYNGYLGWFQADPTTLDPTPRVVVAERTVEMMGGYDTVFDAATVAYSEGDFQWAAELLTYLIRIDNDDMPSRILKAAALRQLAYSQININWRNWYLTSAYELEGRLNLPFAVSLAQQAFSSPSTRAYIPVDLGIISLGTRIDPERAKDVNMTLGINVPDVNRGFGITIRNGVVEYSPFLPEDADMVVTFSGKPLVDKILTGDLTLREAVDSGEITITGEKAQVKKFFSYFDEPFYQDISLTIR